LSVERHYYYKKKKYNTQEKEERKKFGLEKNLAIHTHTQNNTRAAPHITPKCYEKENMAIDMRSANDI
jgi:hypothetical protein